MRYFLTAVIIMAAAVVPTRAQSNANLLAAAAKAEMEEKIRRLAADLEDLKVLNATLTANLNTVTKQVRAQNEAMKDFADAYKIALSDYARRDSITQLTRSVRDVERNRDADKKLFLEKFNELRKLILDNPPKVLHVPANPRNNTGGRTARSDEPAGVYHDVGPKQTLTDIIVAYNSELKRKGRKARVTLSQVTAANPGLNPNLIRPGQKIFIPIID
jgi:LysM repeat protein